VVRLTKEEDYANPETAIQMAIEVHRSADSPFEDAESEMAVQINLKFQDYQSMIEFYYEV
jgi:hypothetical protein